MTPKNVKLSKLQRQLRRLYACDEAVEWVGDRDLPTAWAECERADWLVYLSTAMMDKPGWATRQQLGLATCACVRTALPYVPAGEMQPLKTIETAEAYFRGEATLDEVRLAAKAVPIYAEAGNAAANAVVCVAYLNYPAAISAAASAAAYAAGSHCALTPAYADAVGVDAAICAAHAAAAATGLKSHKEMCAIIRQMLPLGEL